MAQFVEGELVVLQNATYFEEWNGCLAVVDGRLKLRNPRNILTMERETIVAYSVQPLVEGAIKVICKTYQLRKLRGPDAGEELREMEDMGQPEIVMD